MCDEIKKASAEPSAPKCNSCGQFPEGQGGEYPCKACGLPTVHDEPSAPVEIDDEYDYRTDLAAYFGISYASWLTLPRVLMESMPKSWQESMATLLNEYDDAYPNQPELGTTVRVTKGGKIIKTPEWLINYRHPNLAMIEQTRSKPNLGRKPS